VGQAVLDSALQRRDRVIVMSALIVGAGEVRVALRHVETAGLRKVRQLVEDRPRLGEVALLQRSLKAHSD
jgi:hypothetical protein